MSLTSKVALSMRDSTFDFFAAAARAFTSLGKQEPPNPAPALRNSAEIRLSSPIPSATCLKSIPQMLDMFAISFTKEIFVARNELEAYFINSAVLGIHSSLVQLYGLYKSFNNFLAISSAYPITILSGF